MIIADKDIPLTISLCVIRKFLFQPSRKLNSSGIFEKELWAHELKILVPRHPVWL